MVVDVLFLCFAIDTKYNDGSPGREFYMDKVLMEFVENSRKAMKEAGKGGVADARELKPMSSSSLIVRWINYFWSLILYICIYIQIYLCTPLLFEKSSLMSVREP
uniref:Solute carrier family 44 member 1 n=1 Tax=Macaca fascicularis TaxID=9541 RepID=A0A2K5VMZ9_MACFA